MSDCKIFRYLPETGHKLDPPMNIDYRRGLNRGLYRVETLGSDHRPTKVEYFADSGADDLIVRETYTWADMEGGSKKKTVVIEWIREDDTAHPDSKTVESPEHSVSRFAVEGKIRISL